MQLSGTTGGIITYYLLSLPSISFVYTSLEEKETFLIFISYTIYLLVFQYIPVKMHQDNDLQLFLLRYEILHVKFTWPQAPLQHSSLKLTAGTLLLTGNTCYSLSRLVTDSRAHPGHQCHTSSPPQTQPTLQGPIRKQVTNSK